MSNLPPNQTRVYTREQIDRALRVCEKMTTTVKDYRELFFDILEPRYILTGSPGSNRETLVVDRQIEVDENSIDSQRAVVCSCRVYSMAQKIAQLLEEDRWAFKSK